jgi:hypothetical protein
MSGEKSKHGKPEEENIYTLERTMPLNGKHLSIATFSQ